MKINVYNQAGEIVGEKVLSSEIFGLEVKPELVQFVLEAQLANKRRSTAHIKTRGEVRGGGRKPWRQKGTGRARVGSIRSPLWRGGGVVFGPRKEKVYKKKVNKKVKRKALLMCLSDKAKNDKIILLQDLKLEKPKTKEMKRILDNFKLKNVLISLAEKEEKIIRAAKNIKGVRVLPINNLNVYDLLKSEYLLTTLKGIEKIEKIWKKS